MTRLRQHWPTIAAPWLVLAASAATAQTTASSAVPDTFVDPDTHLMVAHLTRVPNDRSGVIYFT